MCDEKSEDGVTACSCAAPDPAGTIPDPAAARVIRKIPLVRGLPREKLFRTIQYHLRAGDASRRALAFYLLDLEERREHKAAGAKSAVHYAQGLGLSRREARELLDVARAMEKLPLLDEAFGRGDIGWSKLRKIALVATAGTEEKWLAFARERTSADVEAAVRHARHGEPPPAGDGLGTRRVTFRIQYDVSSAVNTLWQTALGKSMAELGEGATVQDALKLMAELVLRKDPEGNVQGRRDRTEPIYTVVYHVAADGRSGWVEGEEGRVPIPLSAAIEATGHGRVIEVEDLEDPGDTEAIRFGERGSVPGEERDGPATESMRRAVFAREGHRCAVCRSHTALRAHHLKSLGKGGETEIEYLVGLCDGCHSLVHEALLRLEVDGNGVLIAKDAGGRLIRRDRLASEDLGAPDAPLVLLERVESGGASAGTPGGARAPLQASQVVVAPHSLCGLSSVDSIDDLPGVLTAAEWRSLEERIEWSASRRAFLLRPPWSVRGPVLPGGARGHDEVEDAPAPPAGVRPETFAEVIGQERVVENLLLAVRTALARGEALGHVLLSGPPGLGKTTLARALAAEVGGRFHSILGLHVTEPQPLLAILPRLGRGDVLFIDEVHRLPAPCAECLHGALEDGVLDVLVAEGPRVRPIHIRLEPFTLVGATTELGSLPEPFRARFKVEERLEPYGDGAIARVVERAAERLGSIATAEACAAVAERSRGTPREAIRLLERARDVAQRDGDPAIGCGHVEDAAERLGIDAEGLRIDERRLLEILTQRGAPMGIEALAATLRIEPGTIRRVHEPYLVERGYVVRTPRGREATEKSRQRGARGRVARLLNG